jgi:hypothetical protein
MTGKVGRPRGTDNRDLCVKVRLTGREAFRLAQIARSQKATLSQVIRSAVFGKSERVVDVDTRNEAPA